MRYRVSRQWRNFNGADDIQRFADVGNEIGLACQWHTNKRYADGQAPATLYFPPANMTRPIREYVYFVSARPAKRSHSTVFLRERRRDIFTRVIRMYARCLQFRASACPRDP